jgi:3'-phosphoadenosine 5'-phosphosulfate sulfotransferase (PAPS reductase)/FAD synthetase
VKLNPLANWSETQVWEYLRVNEVPYNALYDQGFTSIGCAPCTRPTRPGEDPRAGRWWWEAEATKECGIHCRIDWASLRA